MCALADVTEFVYVCSILDSLRISSKPQCTSVSSFAARGPRATMEDEHYISSDGCFFGEDVRFEWFRFMVTVI